MSRHRSMCHLHQNNITKQDKKLKFFKQKKTKNDNIIKVLILKLEVLKTPPILRPLLRRPLGFCILPFQLRLSADLWHIQVWKTADHMVDHIFSSESNVKSTKSSSKPATIASWSIDTPTIYKRHKKKLWWFKTKCDGSNDRLYQINKKHYQIK